MKIKLSIILLLMLSFPSKFYAQDVITTFNYPNWVVSKEFNERAALYQVRLTPLFTYVTIQVEPTKNKKRQNFWTSNQTCVIAGNAKLPLLGAEGKDNSYHSCTYNDNWGWNNVSKGQTLYYTLIFSGRIPEGITTFSLVDEATSGRGYSFRNYTINNPKTHALMDEGFCRSNADQNNDGICGIYEEIGGSKYRLACIKDEGNYYLIYLNCADRLTWWFQGDVKALLEESATVGAFKAKWIMQNKTRDDNAYVTFDGKVMKSFLPDGNPSESTYMKMYPSASSKFGGGGLDTSASMWTGTGFALTNNYIVTNYHVIENAKSILIQGVNGDFHKKYEATIMASDKYNDLALLKVNGCRISSDIPYSVKTNTSEVGEEVFVLGYPLTSTMGDEIKLTTGVISSKTGFQGDVSQYQISAPIQPGNSGGPLFDSKGNVIGIVSSKHRGAENVNYAIKASYLRNLMESSINHDILPKNNRITSQTLANKVKSVKNYVYYITCSSEIKYSQTNNNNSYQSEKKNNTGNIIHYRPSYNTRNSLVINDIEISDNYTALYCQYTNTEYDAGGWYSIEPEAYIMDRSSGKKYYLINTYNCALSPKTTAIKYQQTSKFTLYFPPMPKDTKIIDFVESSNSTWKILGIKLEKKN